MSSPNTLCTCAGRETWSTDHVTRKALCLSSERNGGCTSTCSSCPVSIDWISWSGLAECFVNGSAKQYSLDIWDRSSRCPVLLSCLNIWITRCASFCSGKWVVWAVVTRLFASVLMWIGKISPLTSAHKARTKRHVPKNTSSKHRVQQQLSIEWLLQSCDFHNQQLNLGWLFVFLVVLIVRVTEPCDLQQER